MGLNRKQMDILNQRVGETVQNTAAADIGKVQGPPVNGMYTVVTPDGFERKVQNAVRSKWDKDAYVTIECVNGSYRITGIATNRGG